MKSFKVGDFGKVTNCDLKVSFICCHRVYYVKPIN